MNIWLIWLVFSTSLVALENPFNYIQEQKAIHEFRKGNFAQSEALWQKLLIDNPEDAQLLYNLGNATYAQEKYDQADYYFGKAAYLKQICELASLFNQGNARIKKGELEKALESYEAVLALDAKHKEAREMIEKIKKILEEKRQKDQQTKEDSNKQEKEKKEQEKQSPSEEKKDSKEKNNSEQKDQQNSKKEGESNPSADQNKDMPEKEEKKGYNNSSSNKEDTKQESPSTQSKEDNEKKNSQSEDVLKKSKKTREKAQESPECNAQELALFKALDEHEAKSIRQRLKIDLQKGMQEQHGHKNW